MQSYRQLIGQYGTINSYPKLREGAGPGRSEVGSGASSFPVVEFFGVFAPPRSKFSPGGRCTPVQQSGSGASRPLLGRREDIARGGARGGIVESPANTSPRPVVTVAVVRGDLFVGGPANKVPLVLTTRDMRPGGKVHVHGQIK